MEEKKVIKTKTQGKNGSCKTCTVKTKTSGAKKKSKNQNTLKQVGSALGKGIAATGRGIKNTFMEMSDSLAGWVDDTSKEVHREMKKSPARKKKKTAATKSKSKTVTTKSKSSAHKV